MSKVIKAIKAAMRYQHDERVKDALSEVFIAHERDLNYVGYEEDTRTEESIKLLEMAMNEADEETAGSRAELREAIAQSHEASEDSADQTSAQS